MLMEDVMLKWTTLWVLAIVMAAAAFVLPGCGDDDDDDDAADDDAADDDDDQCADTVNSFIAYCPEFDFDEWYGMVCEEHKDEECLITCFENNDVCADIASCYDNDEC